MTYQELANLISKMTYDQLHSDVTICADGDEFFPVVESVHFANEKDEDALDHGHPYLTISSHSMS